jgi:hypothetical protein
MILQVHELETELKQKFRAVDNVNMYGVRLHLYRHLLPVGSLFVELRNSNNVLIKTSEVIDIADIPQTEDYFHGYIRFLISHPLREGLEYFLALKSTGYSFSESAFIGWCNDFDLRRVRSNYAPNAGISAPLGFELWAYELTKRRTN